MKPLKGFEGVTDAEIEKCYSIIAKIIRDYGDVYLPIFQRVHEEREKRKLMEDMKSIALRVAASL